MDHPNAIIGGVVGGSGLGTLVVYVCAKAGFHPSVKEASVITGVVSAAVLFVGRNGLVGTWRALKRLLLHGTGGK